VATVEQCEQALHALAGRLASNDPSHRRVRLDRSLSCSLTDLGIVFCGRIKDGELIEIAPASSTEAQIRLAMRSDDLVALVAGELKIASAWASGRIKVDAGVRDLIKLRSIF
jgi:putative sterol carrier protein